MAVLNVEVENLKCSGCGNTIRRKVEAINGVEGVTVDEAACVVHVLHNGLLVEEEVFDVLKRAGYPKRGTGDILDKAVSYVSCAIGKVQR